MTREEKIEIAATITEMRVSELYDLYPEVCRQIHRLGMYEQHSRSEEYLRTLSLTQPTSIAK